MEKAKFLSRLIAWLVDGFLVGLVIIISMFVFGGIIGLMSGTESQFLGVFSAGLLIVMLVALFLLHFIYFGYFWSTSGQTPGMKLLDMKVVRRSGEPMSFIRSALRGTVGYYISSLIFMLGYIWATFDDDAETWHDKIFDTWVVGT